MLRHLLKTNTIRFKFNMFILLIMLLISIFFVTLGSFFYVRLHSLEKTNTRLLEQSLVTEWQGKVDAWSSNLLSQISDPLLQYDLPKISLFLQSMMQKQEVDYIYILDSHGRILLEKSRDPKDRPTLGQVRLTPEQLTVLRNETVNYKNLRIITMPVLSPSGMIKGFIQLGVSSQKLRVAVSENLVKLDQLYNALSMTVFAGTALLFLLAGLVIIFGGYFLTNRYILQPIDDLKLGIKYVSDANLYYRIFMHATDEFNGLAASFNEMTDKLQNTVFSKVYVDNIFSSISDALIVTTMDGTILKLNDAVVRLLGYKKTELLGKPIESIFPEDDREDMKKTVHIKLLQRGELSPFETECQKKSGQLVPVLFSGKIMYDKAKQTEGIAWSAQDITTQKEAEAKLEHLAKYDTLTNMPNRFFFNEYIQLAMVRSVRTSHKMALLYMDLDYFKEVNDTLGHDMGDLLLQEVPKRIKANMRAVDFVARLGGDEFVIVIEDIKEIKGLCKITEKIIKIISEEYLLNGHKASVSTSIGIAIFPDDADNAEQLMKHADTALYAAKAAGRSIYKFYSDPT